MVSPNGIRAVLFDLDGTLRLTRPAPRELFSDYVSSLGIGVSDEDRTRAARWEHLYFADSPEIRLDQATYDGDTDGFWLRVAERRLVALGLSAGQSRQLAAQVSEQMRANYRPEVFAPPDCEGALGTLRAAGFVLGVVSNRDSAYESELEQLGLSPHIHFSLAAGQVGVYKPAAGIFRRAVEVAGTEAQQTMYVGDNYFANIVGARAAGLQPVLYDHSGTFPDADCTTICSFTELTAVVGGFSPVPSDADRRL